MHIQRFTSANAYFNGQDHMGKVAEIDLPEIKFDFEEYKVMGLLAKIEIPKNGIDKLEAKIKWKAFYPATAIQIANPNVPANIIVRGNQETHNILGRVEQSGVIVSLTGFVKNFPLGKLKETEISDLETIMTVLNCEIIIDNIHILTFDALTNTLVINGIDIWAGAKANM